MCAYNRFEGKPCCGSDRLLMQILRDEWKFKYLVVSDCGAINDFYNRSKHHTHPDSASASADAVLAGTDVECGGSYKSLVDAVKKAISKRATSMSAYAVCWQPDLLWAKWTMRNWSNGRKFPTLS